MQSPEMKTESKTCRVSVSVALHNTENIWVTLKIQKGAQMLCELVKMAKFMRNVRRVS